MLEDESELQLRVFKDALQGTSMSKVYHFLLKDNPSAIYQDLEGIKEAMLKDKTVTFYGSEGVLPFDDRFVPLMNLEDEIRVHSTFALQKDSKFQQAALTME